VNKIINIRDAIRGRIPDLEPPPIKTEPITTIGQVIRAQKHRTNPPVRNRKIIKSNNEPKYIHRHYLNHVLKKDMWKGHRCFIIGGGKSLSNFDWSNLDGELVIGINRAYEMGDWAVNVGMDSDLNVLFENGSYGNISKERWNSFAGARAWFTDSNLEFPPADESHRYNNYVIEPAGRTEFPLDNPGRLSAAKNSGYLALNLACVLGANPIYMLGFDMYGNGSGMQAWWHNGYDESRIQADSVYDGMIKDFTELKPRLDSLGIEVINLNKKSRLTCFKRKSWSESKIVKVRRPTVVTTISSKSDENYADELKFSAALYGLKCYILNDSKPNAINRVARENNNDVLWLNPRSRFTKYPSEFDNCPEDIDMDNLTYIRKLNNNADKS
jgi:hypothetical protein